MDKIPLSILCIGISMLQKYEYVFNSLISILKICFSYLYYVFLEEIVFHNSCYRHPLRRFTYVI